MASDTTASPAPFSPFSSYSSTSGATSDEAPDLGAFTTVFRALNTFHAPRGNALQLTDSGGVTPTDTWTHSDYDSEAAGGSTVWSHLPIASYLTSSSPETPLGSPSPTDTESGLDEHTVTRPIEEFSQVGFGDVNSDQPSLGFLGALDFLAEERARFVAQRDAGVRVTSSAANTSDSTWRHVIQPRRKRRRKRNRSAQETSISRRPLPVESTEEVTEDGETMEGASAPHDDDVDDSPSSDDISRSRAHYYESTPNSPQKKGASRARLARRSDDERPAIPHSKSTPTLRLHISMPIDARILQLRNLAHKLRMLFPSNASALSAILSNDQPDAADFVDPRGPVPRLKDTLIHVFIDHSNILIGFLSYLRRHRLNRKLRYMSHAALALILERGRPVTRRVLATSSPLYQPVDSAEQLGYEVHVLQRVPDDGDGASRQHGSSSSGADQPRSSPQHHIHRQSSPRHGVTRNHRGHSHKSSVGGNTSTESDNNNGSSGSARVRYREQGVDELLQLKLHQAIASTDEVPINATIVLATGDGNVGQYNEEGFLGCVRLALKKGWKVELYAWEGGLSKAWKREFGSNNRFEIYMLDRFAIDLLEL